MKGNNILDKIVEKMFRALYTPSRIRDGVLPALKLNVDSHTLRARKLPIDFSKSSRTLTCIPLSQKERENKFSPRSSYCPSKPHPFSSSSSESNKSNKNTIVRIKRILLTVRGQDGITDAVNFYGNGLGLHVIRFTDDWAEISTVSLSSQEEAPRSDIIKIHLKGVYNEAELSKGYSPILSFDVDDMESTITQCLQHGGNLDGPIQYPAHGKVATIRGPCGHMIGLYEPAS